MNRFRILVLAGAAVGLLGAAVAAEGATPAQARAKCRAAWSGPASGPAYQAYVSRCVTAAVAATDAATDAGNPTNPRANRARAVQACGRQFPPPRRTAARTKAYQACIAAAVATQVSFAGRPLRAVLSGANEIPPAGGATGNALIRLNQGRNRICYTITTTGLGSPVTAAHIHTGAATASGPPVVALSNIDALNSGGAATGCEQGVDASLIRAIRQRPDQYYVNVHTQQFPNGAARGQLAK